MNIVIFHLCSNRACTIVFHEKKFNQFSLCIERDMAQWLECGALSMSLPAVRFRIPLGAGFSEKYHVSLLSILGHW